MIQRHFKNKLTSPKDFEALVHYHHEYSRGIQWKDANKKDAFHAVALAAREWIMDQRLNTEQRYQERAAKEICYLSMEFLMGRSLTNNLHNLGIFDLCKGALEKMGIDIEEVAETERDAALGNGGLGRLAACFLDSLATLGMPGYGYGINYQFGLFKQYIDRGYQKEKPDQWPSEDSPWLIDQPSEAVIIPVYGHLQHDKDLEGNYNPMWMNWKVIVGVPHDLPIIGYGGKTVNVLRLFSARSSDEFDMEIFNEGDYLKAVEQKMSSETLSKVLYPSDAIESGKELRLLQEYFLVACSLRDIVRRFQKTNDNFDDFPSKVAIQLNDTHPALTVAELMRFLVDENAYDWDRAWEITTATLGYTNHTLLPEALEKWSVPLMQYVVPRHLQIIFEINRRFLKEVSAKWPGDNEKLQRMSLIEESQPQQVRMSHLSIVGSHSTNGVAALHSELVKTSLVPDFYEMFPERFNNKTNGVTQRRWLLACNPDLASLITKTIKDHWITDLDKLRALEKHCKSRGFQDKFMDIKQKNKQKLAEVIKQTTRITVDPDSLFDIQAKRIHEYKRQLLNIMHIIHQYLSIVEDGIEPEVPKTYIFAGKAAPGYWAAKQIIKLTNSVAEIVNNDPKVRDLIKVVFLPDYRVSLGERIFPAADLSEQISTAGKEASGTGNMKFALNGALTIGTLDGANIEIMEEVGKENIFIFGLKADEVLTMKREHSYHPYDYYIKSPVIRRVMDAFKNNRFSPNEPGIFQFFFDCILNHGDEYFHLADLESYIEAQKTASNQYKDRSKWAEMAILNVARIGKFSSDRTISEYAHDIWNVQPVL